MMYQFGDAKINLKHVHGVSDIIEYCPGGYYVKVYVTGNTINCGLNLSKEDAKKELEKLEQLLLKINE